ncbi:putative disease resistance protein At5g05400 [Dioscorea cayenensis subsp. rotundata]|uniref:Disease resistance protein At5g05400 n=1 Tax=Dioscorea cayennensis subsp. rotundata TaxID=55577 RepID=A0AB40C3U4_DIOCR|nr:putative disease resistance protein At5g05400 [Dioscorea cayenensis subsp. rotundata]
MASLPKLKKLTLGELPALTSIYRGKLVCDSLCEIRINDCPKLKNLPFLMNNEVPVGMSIFVSEEWWKTVEWADPQLKELVQPSFGCHGYSFSRLDLQKLAINSYDGKLGNNDR